MKTRCTGFLAITLLLCGCGSYRVPQPTAEANAGEAAACYTYGHQLLTRCKGKAARRVAVQWLHQAAEQGHIRAAAALGACYTHGLGTKPDTAKARHWYTIAADAGHPHAEMALAEHYMKCAPTNPELAVQYIRYAAMQGLPNAAFMMFLCFAEGYGVPQEPKLATGWLLNAAELGHPQAADIVKQALDAEQGGAEIQ